MSWACASRLIDQTQSCEWISSDPTVNGFSDHVGRPGMAPVLLDTTAHETAEIGMMIITRRDVRFLIETTVFEG